MHKKKDKHQRNIKKIPIWPIIFIPLLVAGVTFAQYVSEKHNEAVFQTGSFYFESTVLKEENPPIYEYEKGVNSISIDLNNFADELRNSELDINYTVSLTDSNGNTMTDMNGNTIADKTGVLPKNRKHTENIEFKNLKSGTYTVTANATSPFQKTLKANFVITQKDDEIKYSVSDSIRSAILQLTISTQDYSGDIQINWPEGVSPNSSDSKFQNVNTGFSQGNYVIHFEANSEYTFNFFKKDPNNVFKTENFSIEKK